LSRCVLLHGMVVRVSRMVCVLLGGGLRRISVLGCGGGSGCRCAGSLSIGRMVRWCMRKRLSLLRVVLASLLGCVAACCGGWSLASGCSVRFRTLCTRGLIWLSLVRFSVAR